MPPSPLIPRIVAAPGLTLRRSRSRDGRSIFNDARSSRRLPAMVPPRFSATWTGSTWLAGSAWRFWTFSHCANDNDVTVFVETDPGTTAGRRPLMESQGCRSGRPDVEDTALGRTTVVSEVVEPHGDQQCRLLRFLHSNCRNRDRLQSAWRAYDPAVVEPMIVIIDYGMGNLRSVQKAIEAVGHRAEITSDPDRGPPGGEGDPAGRRGVRRRRGRAPADGAGRGVSRRRAGGQAVPGGLPRTAAPLRRQRGGRRAPGPRAPPGPGRPVRAGARA